MRTPSSELPHGTVTFLFTDIERSTDLARQLGADFGRVRSEHRQLLRDAFGRHDGHEIDTAGDGFFVAFERAGDTVAAAIDAQRALTDGSVRVRMGVHTAEPYLDDEGYIGVGVHRAARICAAGHGGQILLSNATAGIVDDLDLAGVQLEDLGEHRLKDIERPERLFQVVAEGLEQEFPPLKSLDAPTVITLVAADVIGWHPLMRQLGDEQAVAAARAYQRIAARAVADDGGRVLEAVADNLVVGFERPGHALRGAKRLRDALRTEAWSPMEAQAVRMAVHSGQVVAPRSGELGSTAFRCLALCSTAEPWQILVSHATEALLEGEPAGAELRDLGERLDTRGRIARVFELV